MEAKVIIVSVVKSNKSENNVWAVGITGEEQEQAYCKSAWKAMKFAFLLKKQTGLYIEDDSLKMLSEEIARQKAAAAEAGQPAEQEAQPEVPAEVEQPLADAKPKKEKKARKPRTKKVQAEPVEVAPVYSAAEAADLIAFV